MASRTLRFAFTCLLLTFTAVSAFAQAPEPAPRFNAKTLKGEKFTSESLKGKVVLLQFWTTWCPYCRRDAAMVDKIEKLYADKGLVILAVNVNESKKMVLNYLKETPRSCRVVLTEDTNLAARFAAKEYPIYIVIDKGGNIVEDIRGSVAEAQIRNALRTAGLDID